MGQLNNVDKDEGTISLKVSAQIVKHISSGLYRNPGSALKELISNAFDADAEKVEITFDFDYNEMGSIKVTKLTIEDNGEGMDINDLKTIFSHVGGSSKDDPFKEPVTKKFKRPVIGSFGIGMLSVASTCNRFKITTKKNEQSREFTADVSLSFFRNTILRTESMDKVNLGNIDLSSRHVDKEYEHYTKYEISNFEPPFLEGLIPTLISSFLFKTPRGDNVEDDKYFENFVLHLQNMKEKSTQALAYLDKMITDVGVMAPVEYLPDGPIRRRVNFNGTEHEVPGTNHRDYLELIERPKGFKFEVRVRLRVAGRTHNEFKVFKPFLYPCEKDLEEYGFEGLNPKVLILPKIDDDIPDEEGSRKHVSISGFYYHQDRRIIPYEFHGFLFRVKNVALGYNLGDPFALFTNTYLLFHQSFSEVYLDGGFQRIVNLDRESLYEGSYLFRFLTKYLRRVIKPDASNSDTTSMTLDTDSKKQSEKDFQETAKQAIERSIKTYNVENIVGNIKKEVASKRKARKQDALVKISEKVNASEKVEKMIIARSNKVSEIGIRREGEKTYVTIPKFKKRNELWDNLAMGTLNIVKDEATRIEMMRFVMKLYSELEHNDLN